MVEKEKYLNQTDILRRQAEEKTTSMIENLEVMSEEMLHELRELRIQQIELKRQNQIELDIMRAYFKEREEQLLNIFVKAPLGIFHSVWEGRFLTANPALAKMLGYSSPEELISATHDMTTQIYADPIIRPQIMDALMKSDGWVHYDKILWRRKDGSVIAVDMTGRKVLDATGAFAYLEGFIADITERVQVEREIQNLNQTLHERVAEETQRRLDQERLLANNVRRAAVGEMIGAIAHQWRQPLSTLGMIVQRAHATGTMQGLTLEYLDEFKANAMRQIMFMSETIDEFRSFYIMDKEKVMFYPSRCISAAVRLVKSLFASKEIGINLQFHDFESLQSIGFPNEFKQVILNLLSNSRDAILQRRKTDGQPEVGCITINISVPESGSIIIHVKDNGSGIPAGFGAMIFDPYFTTKDEVDGTGIGLYMSRIIVEDRLEGRLILVEESLDGAVFRIELPLWEKP